MAKRRAIDERDAGEVMASLPYWTPPPQRPRWSPWARRALWVGGIVAATFTGICIVRFLVVQYQRELFGR